MRSIYVTGGRQPTDEWRRLFLECCILSSTTRINSLRHDDSRNRECPSVLKRPQKGSSYGLSLASRTAYESRTDFSRATAMFTRSQCGQVSVVEYDHSREKDIQLLKCSLDPLPGLQCQRPTGARADTPTEHHLASVTDNGHQNGLRRSALHIPYCAGL